MKKLSSFLLFLLLAIGFANSSMAKPNLKVSFNTQKLYYAMDDSSVIRLELHVNILTPDGLFTGTINKSPVSRFPLSPGHLEPRQWPWASSTESYDYRD